MEVEGESAKINVLHSLSAPDKTAMLRRLCATKGIKGHDNLNLAYHRSFTSAFPRLNNEMRYYYVDQF